MKILFFDTETTGKPGNFRIPMSNVENWPRLVQLGWIMYDGGAVVTNGEDVVFPDGFTIPEEASKIHGIYHADAVHRGVTISSVLAQFVFQLASCDAVAGHNVAFDINVVGAEWWRLHSENPFSYSKTLDTMIAGTDFCKIPSPFKTSSYKWPKLSELYEKLFDEPMGAAHTALQDIQNTAKCYFEMEKRGLINGQ